MAEFGANGVVQMNTGWGSPPAIYKNFVITGGGEPTVRAWDARTGALVWTCSLIAQPGNAWTRDVGERGVEAARRHQRVGVSLRRCRQRPGVRSGVPGRLRLCGPRTAGQQPLCGFGGGDRRQHGQTALVSANGPSRHLGLRPARAADADRHHAQRPEGADRGPARQDRHALHLQPADRRADLSGRRAAGAEEHDRGREDVADATLHDHVAAAGAQQHHEGRALQPHAGARRLLQVAVGKEQRLQRRPLHPVDHERQRTDGGDFSRERWAAATGAASPRIQRAGTCLPT